MLRIFQIFLRLVWRWLVALFVFFRGFGLALWRNRVITAVILVLFGVGIVVQEFEGEIKTGIDIVYECGVYPTAQITASLLNLIFTVPYEFVTPLWNDLVLFLFDITIGALTSDLRTLVRAGKLVNVRQGFTATSAFILGGDLAGIGDIVGEILAAIADYLAELGKWFTDVLAWLTEVIGVFLLEISIFGKSCSLCSADPTPDCDLRQPFLADQGAFDCNECHELVADAFALVGQFFDAATANFVGSLSEGTSFRRIGRAIGCVLRSTYMYPVQMVQALIQLAFDECISLEDIINVADTDSMVSRWWLAGTVNCGGTGSGPQTCCGKPAGCDLYAKDTDDLPIGIVGCTTELIRALTDDKIVDIVELILAFLFTIVNDVILTVERTIFCFSTATFDTCMGNYPASGSTPGTCAYNDNTVFPTGGLHECFAIVHDCLAFEVDQNAPLLLGFVGEGTVIQFLLGDLWKFSVDFAVCPFAVLPPCFPPAFTDTTCGDLGGHTAPFDVLDGAICSFDCVRDTNPVLGPFFGFLADVLNGLVGLVADAFVVIDEIKASLLAIQGVFDCVLECDIPELGEGSLFKCFDINAPESEKCDEPLAGAMAQRRRSVVVPDTPEKLAKWVQFVDTTFLAPPTSFCGEVLRASSPKAVSRANRGDYFAYYGCYSMYIASTAGRNWCQLDWAVDSPSKLATAMRVCNTSYAADKRAARPPSAPLFNLTMSRTGATQGSNGNASWWHHFGTGMANVSGWEVNKKYIQPFWKSLQTTRVFRRTHEFYNKYRTQMHELDAEPSGSPRAVALKQQMDDVYVAYANDVLSLWRTRKWRNETTLLPAPTAGEGEDEAPLPQGVSRYVGLDGVTYTDATADGMRELPGKLWSKMEELHITEPKKPGSKGTDELHAQISPQSREAWAVINGATHIEFQPWFQSTAGVIRALRRRDIPTASKVLRGKTKYIASTNEFVSRRVFDSRMPDAIRPGQLTASGQPHPTLVGLALGTSGWSARLPRRYAPFPIPEDTVARTQPSWTTRSHGVMSRAHSKYQAQRRAAEGVSSSTSDSGPAAAGTTRGEGPTAHHSRQTGAADFDATAAIIGHIDATYAHIVSLFGVDTSGSLFQDFIDNTILFFESFDFQDFSNATQTLEDYFSCSIPENIDGTSLYSPFCIFLANEKAFSPFAVVSATTSQFPPQVPWPAGVISRPCVSQFSGDPFLFTFEFSDNCILPESVSDTAICAGSCVGTVDLTASYAVTTRDKIVFVVDQSAGDATCGIENVVIEVPTCATVENVTGSCVTGFDADINATTDQGCVPAHQATPDPSSNVMRVNVSFPMGGTCAFVVHYSEKVDFPPGAAQLLLDGVGEDLCTNCSLRFPTVTCLPSDTENVDFFKEHRPLCDSNGCGATCLGGGCDYCEREYGGCKLAGFSDVLDTMLYLTGIAPLVFDEILFGGYDVRLLEDWIGMTVVLFFWVSFFPSMLALFGIPIFLLWAGFAHVISWTFFIFFDGLVPWPIIFAFLSIYVNARSQGIAELVLLTLIIIVSPGLPPAARLVMLVLVTTAPWKRARVFLRPVFVLIGLVDVIWLLSLIFTFPSLAETLNINQALADILLYIDDSILLFPFDVTGLRARVNEFVFDSIDDVTDEMTHCFWWNWRDMAMALLLILFNFYWFALFFRFFFAPVLAIVDGLILFMHTWFRVRLIRLREKLEEVDDDVEDNESRIAALKKRMSETWDKFKARVTNGVLGNGSTGGSPSLPPAGPPRPRRDTRLHLGRYGANGRRKKDDDGLDDDDDDDDDGADGDEDGVAVDVHGAPATADDDNSDNNGSGGEESESAVAVITPAPGSTLRRRQPANAAGGSNRRRSPTILRLNGNRPQDLEKTARRDE